MDDLRISHKHIWVKMDGEDAIIGLTDYAQEKLKAIMFINLPDKTEQIFAGKKLGDVESIKTVSDLIAPVSGTVKEVNEELIDEPDLINESPYDAWLVRISDPIFEIELMDLESYDKCKGEL